MALEHTETGTKCYEIRQLADDGSALSTATVEALSGEAAAKQLREKEVHDGTGHIVICLDGQAVNEMSVGYWRKRLRQR